MPAEKGKGLGVWVWVGRREGGRCLALGRKMGRLQGRTRLEDAARICLDCCSNGGAPMKGGQKASGFKLTISPKVTRSACARAGREDLKENYRPR